MKEFLNDGCVTVCITGDCMHSTLSPGSLVFLEKRRLYWPGDIVAFQRSENEIVSHRFLGYFPGKKCWRAITRADAASKADTPINTHDILGSVSKIAGAGYRPSPAARARSFIKWLPAAGLGIVSWLISSKSGPETVE